jgi:hypothetical protein
MKCERDWQGIPIEAEAAWRRIFSESKDGIDVDGLCPVCGSPDLHQWYDKPLPFEVGHERDGFRGHGSLWEWCSSCHCYEHYSALVPSWWQDVCTVDPALLTHTPEAIESARLNLP